MILFLFDSSPSYTVSIFKEGSGWYWLSFSPITTWSNGYKLSGSDQLWTLFIAYSPGLRGCNFYKFCCHVKKLLSESLSHLPPQSTISTWHQSPAALCSTVSFLTQPAPLLNVVSLYFLTVKVLLSHQSVSKIS